MAYMQEVGGYLGGELDYMKLKGDTGPLVYPAGEECVGPIEADLDRREPRVCSQALCTFTVGSTG